MKKAALLMVLGFISVVLMVGMATSTGVFAGPIQLNWAAFVPNTNPPASGVQQLFIDKVNERAKGELVIKYRGGPETIPPFDLGKAVQKGVVDIGMAPVGFYEPIAPGIGGAQLTQLTLEEERKPGGGYDYLNELHRAGGLFYLGRGTFSREDYFYLWLNKKVEKPEDFKKIQIGSATGSRAAVVGWGAVHVSLRMGEYFQAMERGVADGIAGVPLTTYVSMGIHEVTKYCVDHPYWQSTVAVFMNLDSWNKLPKNLKELIMECQIEAEKDFMALDVKDRALARKKAETAGVEFYKLAPDIAKWFLDTAYNATWDYQMKRFPKETPRLRELLSK
jgi:TRAP-type C4-dicarboxylate transport system substrate-binding protein